MSHLLVAGAALVLQTVGCGAVAVKVRPGLCHLCKTFEFQSGQIQEMGHVVTMPVTCSERVHGTNSHEVGTGQAGQRTLQRLQRL